jgi:cell wall-associated NlpC family hydrolase
MVSTKTGSGTGGGLALAGVLAALALGGCATPPAPRPADWTAPPGHAVSAARHEVVRAAAGQIGTPYRYGGSTRRGFDCSGLVQYAHRQAGIEVPRTTAAQWTVARTPHREHLLPGDLLFFNVGAKKSRHVGIYEGSGLFIHAPSSGKEVSRASLDNPFWQSRLIGTRTFL